MADITDLSVDLAPGRYLLYFSINPFSVENSRVLSDFANVHASLVNNYNPTDWNLNGTTVQGGDNPVFIADVQANGSVLGDIVNTLISLLSGIINAVVTFLKGVAVLPGA